MDSADATGDVSKKENLALKIQQREEERLKELSKKREEQEKTNSKTENTQFFMETLTSGVATIKRGLATASNQEKGSLPAYFDSLSLKLAEVQKFVTDSAMFLASYDLAQKQQQLIDLQSEIALCRSKLIPKSKFAFRNRKKQSTPAALMVVGYGPGVGAYGADVVTQHRDEEVDEDVIDVHQIDDQHGGTQRTCRLVHAHVVEHAHEGRDFSQVRSRHRAVFLHVFAVSDVHVAGERRQHDHDAHERVERVLGRLLQRRRHHGDGVVVA